MRRCVIVYKPGEIEVCSPNEYVVLIGDGMMPGEVVAQCPSKKWANRIARLLAMSDGDRAVLLEAS